jgi:hypothetical protein
VLLQDLLDTLLNTTQTDVDLEILVKEELKIIVDRYVRAFLENNDQDKKESLIEAC